MKWTELLDRQIKSLEEDKIRVQKKLENELKKNNNIGRKTELMSEIQGIDKSIFELYVCLGRCGEVTE